MWRIDAAARWHTDPFPYAVLDDVVSEDDLERVMAILDEEPVDHVENDIYSFDATAPEPTTQAFRELRDAFARELAPSITQMFGRAVSRADMRAYAYRPGDYLLPHTDCQDGLGRVVAYVYYLPSPEPPSGGELELYRCASEQGELVTIDSAKLVQPRANRLVVFEVSELSLHQVREVMSGLRISLAGWFYA